MTPAERDTWARGVLRDAWAAVFPGDAPDLAELQALQAQGRHEGFYGFATHPPEWEGSNNWGAVMWTPRSAGAHFGGGGSIGFFEATDHRADGSAFTARFKKYATPQDGAADLLWEALVRRPNAAAVLDGGNLTAYATELRAAHYFGAPVDLYAQALFHHAQAIAQNLGEPLAVALDHDTTSTRPAPSPSTGNTVGLVLVSSGLAALALSPKLRRWIAG